MNNFAIIKILGQGSFGSALLVEDPLNKKPFVVKRIPLFKQNQKEKEEAMKEVEVLSKLQHPNIITYHKSFVEDLNLYIVTDYCDGGDLYSKIKSQNGVLFKEDQVLDWFVQICLAVKHVHDRRILHRDIKTQNIFLTKSGIAKLGDFGIARILNHTTELAQTCIGTPFYLSPEICENKPYNNKTDIWSLGCVLYELTTLKHPFQAKNLKNLFFRILKCSLPQIPDVYCIQLKELLNEIFVRNPRDRPSVNYILRKPIILERISKFLDEKKMKEEFSKSFFQKIEKYSGFYTDPNFFKPKFTNPSAKYGVSVARKRMPKVEPKKVPLISNESILNKKNAKFTELKTQTNTGAVFKNKVNHNKQNSKGNNSNRNTNKTKASQSLSVGKRSMASSPKSTKSKSPISFCIDSHVLNFPTLSSTESQVVTTEASSSSSTSSEMFSDSNTCFNNSLQTSALKISLPLIDVNYPTNKQKSKWSRPKIDFLCNLPFETTGSDMDATSPYDKVTLYQPRPHSAPHIGRKAKPLETEILNEQACSKNCVEHSLNNNSVTDISKTDILSESENRFSGVTPGSKDLSSNHINIIDSALLTSQNLTSENMISYMSVALQETSVNVPPIETLQEIEDCQNTVSPTGSKTYKINDNGIMNEKTFKISPEKNNNLSKSEIALPLISSQIFNVQNAFMTYNVNVPRLNVDLPLLNIAEKTELQTTNATETYKLQTGVPLVSVSVKHLPTLNEEDSELLNSIEEGSVSEVHINTTQTACNSNSFNFETMKSICRTAQQNLPNEKLNTVLISDSDTSLHEKPILQKRNYSSHDKSELADKVETLIIESVADVITTNSLSPFEVEAENQSENVNSVQHEDPIKTTYKVEIGIQCDMINLRHEESKSSSPVCWSPSGGKDLLIHQRQTKQNHHHRSLPDLSQNGEFENKLYCSEKPMKDYVSHSSYSLNKEVSVDDINLELFQTASDIGHADSDEGNDMYHMCQSMQSILHQTKSFDSHSLCSSMVLGQSADVYSDVEEIRIDLENKLGLDGFINAYKKMQLLFESDIKEKKTFEEVLGPSYQHLANDLLNLIIKEEIYMNDSQETDLN